MRSVLLGLGLMLSAALTASSLVASSMAAAPTLLGKDAPDFVLKGMDGRNLRMSEFRGQVVLVNFWARWAGDCRQEMPITAKGEREAKEKQEQIGAAQHEAHAPRQKLLSGIAPAGIQVDHARVALE